MQKHAARRPTHATTTTGLKLSLLAGSVLACTAASNAQSLTIGDSAPDLSAGKWFHCDSAPTLGPGKVHVVAFLQSTSSPSQRAIPVLNRAREAFDGKVDVTGLASLERGSNPTETLETYLDNDNCAIDFPVGCDANREAFEQWAWAAGRPSAPVAFIVDRESNIRWVGSPHHQRFFDELRLAVDGDNDMADADGDSSDEASTGGTIVTVGDDKPVKKVAIASAVKETKNTKERPQQREAARFVDARPVKTKPAQIKATKLVAAPSPKGETKKADPSENNWTLTVGDKAPELHIAEWVKGEPITGFEEGRVHVVEFWATWCGPCVSGMPHLSEIQEEYKDRGVRVMGVNIWDDPKKVAPFMEDRGDKPAGNELMGYTVAIEKKDNPDDLRHGMMSTLWMKAAGQSGIPAAFIIDGAGTIAWIGHPSRIDEPLKGIVEGEWDIASARADFEAAREKRAAARAQRVAKVKAAGEAKKAEADAKVDAVAGIANEKPQKLIAKPTEPKKAQREKPSKKPDPKSLAVGDKAPELTIGEWVKGEPITDFEEGRVHVVEFWATWCGPCIAGMPHMSELQEKYADKGVRIVGVNVWDDPDKVAPFMEDRGSKPSGDELMDYTVAIEEKHPDGDTRKGLMAENWMEAAGQRGIPTAFIIDGKRRVAWIGHPMGMDKPLEQIVNGTWSIKDAADDFAESQRAQEEAMKKRAVEAAKERELEKERAKEGISTKDINAFFADGNIKAGTQALVKLADNDANAAGGIFMQTFMGLMGKNDYDDAYTLAGTMLETDASNNPMLLNTIAWTIVDPEKLPDEQDLDLALNAARKASKLTDNTDPAILDTLAKIYWDMGKKVRALHIQERACSFSRGGQFEEELEGRIRFYRENMRSNM